MSDNRSIIESLTTAEKKDITSTKKDITSTDTVYMLKTHQEKITKLENSVKELEEFKIRLETTMSNIKNLIILSAAVATIILLYSIF